MRRANATELSADRARAALAAAEAAAPPLVSAGDEARAFWRMRLRVAWTLLAQTLLGARFRLSLVVALSASLWGTLFWLSTQGFLFLRGAVGNSPELHGRIVQAGFGIFFMSLMGMLVFSAGIILYGSLYRGRDVALLLSLPVRAERVFLHKFQEAALMSSWAFVLLASPMLLAYGLIWEAPWYYFALLLPFLVSFTYIPAAVGAVGCMAIVRWAPRARFAWMVAPAALGIVALAVFGLSLVSRAETDFLTPGWFQETLNRLRVTEHRWLPSWWLTSGLFALIQDEARDESMAAGRQAIEGCLFLVLLTSNALFFRLLAVGAARWTYRAGYDRVHARRTPPRLGRTARIDRMVDWLMWGTPSPMRLMVVKDFRVFRRDPVQWSQTLIFLGLLSLYFVNIRRLAYDSAQIGWVNLISFLNVFVVGLLLSTFTTRFIFPMISLEGGRFWVLGLAPLRRDVLLWSKFTFAVGGSVVPCSLLILLSDLMLRVPPLLLGIHQAICVLLSFGLSGMAVGLGARWPSPREQSPARIAAGFGGTLNLVLSTLYIVAIVLLTALPCHFYLGAQSSESAGLLADRLRLTGRLGLWMAGGMASSVLLGLVTTLLPMGIGIRALRRMEF